MTTCILSGSRDALGRRVASLLADAGPVLVMDECDLPDTEMKARLEGAATLVQLGGGVEETRALLDAAGSVGVRHAVLLSSATVYGAWPSNPVPLTEDAAVRPNPQFEFAVRAAERERLAAEWATDHPGSSVALLRPAVPVAEGETGWLADALRAAALVRAASDDDPPVQFVHLDDLASAVALAATAPLDGVFNVAPDGWINGEQLRALATLPRLRLPDRLARAVAKVGRRFGSRAAHPGLLPYTAHSWVVANDRLRAAGWAPAWSAEEAYVAGHPPAPWSLLSPQRRQEIALGALGFSALAAAAGGAALLRRRRR